MHLSTTGPIAVHDNPLRNKRLQRIARVIKAKGKKGKLEETFSSKRQATRIFVYRKNKSCSLFSTHEQRYPRAYRVISFAVHPPFLYVYIYIQYTSLDRRNNGIVRARENCNSAVVAVHACATTVPRNRCATPTRIENRKRSPRSRLKRSLSNLQFTRPGNNRRKSISFRSRADIWADPVRDSRIGIIGTIWTTTIRWMKINQFLQIESDFKLVFFIDRICFSLIPVSFCPRRYDAITVPRIVRERENIFSYITESNGWKWGEPINS